MDIYEFIALETMIVGAVTLFVYFMYTDYMLLKAAMER